MATEQQAESITLAQPTPSNVVLPHPPTALIFDSGVGGLSVYQEIRQLLPDLHVIYVFDNACFPYGEQPVRLIIERVLSITHAIQRHHRLDIVVIACNTASTVSLPALRDEFSIPIVGVVPAIKPAAQLTQNHIIGVLATRATTQRSYTRELVHAFAGQCRVKLLGSTELVEMAEQKLRGKPVDLVSLREILAPWLNLPVPPDTVVLGCTHFPLLRDELMQVLPEGTLLVDSGEAIARRVKFLLGKHEWRQNEKANLAYCTARSEEALGLRPVLRDYGFATLQELTL